MGLKVCTSSTCVIMTGLVKKHANTTIEKYSDSRYMLAWLKLYIDSCTTYHSFFVKKFLSKVYGSDITLTGSCNVGTT